MKITVKLSRPALFNGVQVDKLHLREPLVQDLLDASAAYGESDDRREVFLIARVAEVSEKDLAVLPMKDFRRLQAAWNRFLADDDGVDGFVTVAGDAPAGQGNALSAVGNQEAAGA